MPKLSDMHRVLLSNAAQRDDGAVLPLPKRLEIKPNALTRVLKGLLNKKLVQEQAAPPDAVAWRETKDGQRFMLVVTPAGLEAIGVVPNQPGTSKAVPRRARRALEIAAGNRVSVQRHRLAGRMPCARAPRSRF